MPRIVWTDPSGLGHGTTVPEDQVEAVLAELTEAGCTDLEVITAEQVLATLDDHPAVVSGELTREQLLARMQAYVTGDHSPSDLTVPEKWGQD